MYIRLLAFTVAAGALLALQGGCEATAIPPTAVRVVSQDDAPSSVVFSTKRPEGQPKATVFHVSRNTFQNDPDPPYSELQVEVEKFDANGDSQGRVVALNINEDGDVTIPGDLIVGSAGRSLRQLAEQVDAHEQSLDSHASLINDGSTPNKAVTTCRELYDSGVRTSGYYWVKPCPSAAAFRTECDMGRDGGGWTRIIYYPATQVPIPTMAAWPDAADNAESTQMFKGCLDVFAGPGSGLREEIVSGSRVAWGRDVTLDNLNSVRTMFAYTDQASITYATVPPCTLTSATAELSIVGCQNPAYTSAPTDPPGQSVLGWQRDADGTGHCWAGRGNCCGQNPGSSRCGSDPDGTLWSKLYVREPLTADDDGSQA